MTSTPTQLLTQSTLELAVKISDDPIATFIHSGKLDENSFAFAFAFFFIFVQN